MSLSLLCKKKYVIFLLKSWKLYEIIFWAIFEPSKIGKSQHVTLQSFFCNAPVQIFTTFLALPWIWTIFFGLLWFQFLLWYLWLQIKHKNLKILRQEERLGSKRKIIWKMSAKFVTLQSELKKAVTLRTLKIRNKFVWTKCSLYIAE